MSEQAQRKTLVSDAGTLYCSDFTIDLTLIVAGNRNLTWYPNSIEVEVLAAVIGKKVYIYSTLIFLKVRIIFNITSHGVIEKI